MNAPIHPLNWIAPTPLWASVRDGDNPADNIARPALLRFASDAFMDELFNVMQRDPARVSDYLAQAETWRGMPQQPGREELLAAPRRRQQPASNRRSSCINRRISVITWCPLRWCASGQVFLITRRMVASRSAPGLCCGG
jgi:hypothetical protein